jgi:hypothetical protein
MTKRTDFRIAILGAGPAGLSAALALREKGYRNVTVFEKSGRVGGQALTEEYRTPDGRTLVYDMGSMQPGGSRNLFRLLKASGLTIGRGVLAKKSRVIAVVNHTKGVEIANFTKYYFGVPPSKLPALMSDFLKLLPYLWRYRRLSKPGFHGFQYWDETSVSFTEWLDSKNFAVIRDMLIALLCNMLTFSNAELAKDVRAYHAIKLFFIFLHAPVRYVDGAFRQATQGYQELWKRVARQTDLVLHADLKSITRGPGGITIATGDKTRQFDRLIVACPTRTLAGVMDATTAERDVFGPTTACSGYRIAFLARGGPLDAMYIHIDSYAAGNQPPYLGVVIPEDQVGQDTWLYHGIFSGCAAVDDPVAHMKSAAQNEFRQSYGGEIVEWVSIRHWLNYAECFPYEAVTAGIYDKAEALQGQNNTYYAGYLLSFHTHGAAVDYSYDLVKRFF